MWQNLIMQVFFLALYLGAVSRLLDRCEKLAHGEAERAREQLSLINCGKLLALLENLRCSQAYLCEQHPGKQRALERESSLLQGDILDLAKGSIAHWPHCSSPHFQVELHRGKSRGWPPHWPRWKIKLEAKNRREP